MDEGGRTLRSHLACRSKVNMGTQNVGVTSNNRIRNQAVERNGIGRGGARAGKCDDQETTGRPEALLQRVGNPRGRAAGSPIGRRCVILMNNDGHRRRAAGKLRKNEIRPRNQ